MPSVTSAVASILAWSRRHRALVAVATLALTLGSLAGIRRLAFDTDVLSLLPHDGRVIPAFRSFLATFGNLDQLYIVFTAPEGQSIGDYGEEVDLWIAALRQAPEITRVDSGTADTSRDFGGLAVLQPLLFRGDTLSKALARFGGAPMQAALEDRRALLSVPSPEIAQLV